MRRTRSPTSRAPWWAHRSPTRTPTPTPSPSPTQKRRGEEDRLEPIGKEEAGVVVRHGELLSGVLDKASFGATEFGLVHSVHAGEM